MKRNTTKKCTCSPVKEHRKTGRIRLNLDLNNSHKRFKDLKPAIICMDVSTTGICVLSYSPLPKGKEIEMFLTKGAGTEKIEARGQIIWTKKIGPHAYRTGIRFTDLDA